MQQETTDNQGLPTQTSMSHVWLVVAMSMLMTIVGGFIWHEMRMSEERMANTNESQEMKHELERLAVYRDHLRETLGTATPTE